MNSVTKGPEIRPQLSFRWTAKSIELQIRHNWCVVSYLIVDPYNLGDLQKWVEQDLPDKFPSTMANLVYEYLYENKIPPDEIAQTVLNVSEDMLAGRQVILRAGDYIAIQKYMRAKK